MFLDTITLKLSAGKGGNGVVSWRREKYLPKGGPAGGDGGDGGSIIIQCSPHLYSLDCHRHKHHLKAKDGLSGGSDNKKGKTGEDLLIDVPSGTLIKTVSGEVIADLTQVGETFLICQGGKGGKGNTHFKTATRRAPTKATPGTLGEEKEVTLELKLIADVGFVGMPNAGKSTLLSCMTAKKVKIGNYPFTTLSPNLSLIQWGYNSRLILADIPGLIEGAHENKGLGFSFLKHIERTNLLLFLIDLLDENPFHTFLSLQKELKAYSPDLLDKPFLIALNKIDANKEDEKLQPFFEAFQGEKGKIFPVSAKTGEGVEELKTALKNHFIPEDRGY